MFCANCGTKQNEGEKFCPNCGTRFDEPKIVKEEVSVDTSRQSISQSEIIELPKGKKEETKKDVEKENSDINKGIDVSNVSDKKIVNNHEVQNSEEIDLENNSQKENKTKIERVIASYDAIWKTISLNNDSPELLYDALSTERTGIISDILIKEEVHINVLEDTYLNIDEINGRIEFYLYLKDQQSEINELERRVKAYNSKARDNDYQLIKLRIYTEDKSIYARFVRKKQGFFESIFSWNAEYEFKEILEMCRRLRRTN